MTVKLFEIQHKAIRALAFNLTRINLKDNLLLGYKELSKKPLIYAFPWSQTPQGYKFWENVSVGKEELALSMLHAKEGIDKMPDKKPHNPFASVCNPTISVMEIANALEIDRQVTKRTICLVKAEGISLKSLIDKLNDIAHDVVDKTSNVRIENDMIVGDYSERETEIEKMERIYKERNSKNN